MRAYVLSGSSVPSSAGRPGDPDVWVWHTLIRPYGMTAEMPMHSTTSTMMEYLQDRHGRQQACTLEVIRLTTTVIS